MFQLWVTKVPFPGDLQEMVLVRPQEEMVNTQAVVVEEFHKEMITAMRSEG